MVNLSQRTKLWVLMDLLSVTWEGRTEEQTSVTCTVPCVHHTLIAKISQQNQSVSRLLSKTILYFLHPFYSYLTIHFLVFLFVLALNSIFFTILAFWELMT